MTDTTDEILALERGLWTQAQDSRYFEEHLLDGGLSIIEPMGFIEKEQAVGWPAEKPWIEVEMLDVEIRQVTLDCVILAYHGRGRRDGDETPYEGSIASSLSLQATASAFQLAVRVDCGTATWTY